MLSEGTLTGNGTFSTGTHTVRGNVVPTTGDIVVIGNITLELDGITTNYTDKTIRFSPGN